MANTLGIVGTLQRKVNNVVKTSVSANVEVAYTEYTEQQILIPAGDSASVNLGGLTEPNFLYVDTDNPVVIALYRGVATVASTLPVNDALMITANAANRFGTVNITNDGVEDADVKIYMG